MSTREEQLQRHHNDGQRDGAKGVYEPPHGLVESALTWGRSEMQRNNEDNGAYGEGFKNATK